MKNNNITRVSLALDETLVRKLDGAMLEAQSSNRSEFVRELLREHLVNQAWERNDAEMLGTITILYNHHQREVCASLTKLQHDSAVHILAATHVHLSHELCAEMIMGTGTPEALHALHCALRRAKGVLHAVLSMSSTGSELE